MIPEGRISGEADNHAEIMAGTGLKPPVRKQSQRTANGETGYPGPDHPGDW